MLAVLAASWVLRTQRNQQLVQPQEPQVCVGMEDKLEGMWDDEQRARVEAAIQGTGSSHAPATWVRVERRLDDYTHRWVAARTEACMATHRGEQSGELLDLRMACLDERLLHVQVTVKVLAQADTSVVDKAVQAVARLPGLERCADLGALKAGVPLPEDPELALRVKTLGQQLVEAEALGEAGKYDQALAIAEASAAEAVAMDYEPLQARAWLRQGTLQIETADYEGAEATLEKAYGVALGQQMTAEAAGASMLLVHVVGYRLARYDDGRRWAVHADPLSRAAGSDKIRARYLDNLGIIAESEGKYDEARSHYERALAIAERALGSDQPDLANSLNNLGIISFLAGKHDEARAFHERALAIEEEALGPEHPHVAVSLNNLGIAAASQGKYDEARAYWERALTIAENTLGPEHPDLARPLTNLGVVAASEGEYADARAYHERALAIWEKVHGPDHPQAAHFIDALGEVAMSEEKFEQAHALYERALTIRQSTLGDDHPLVATTLSGLSQTLLSQGQPAAALPHLERALAIRSSTEVDPAELAATRFGLARALWDAPSNAGRNHARARAQAELARSTYADLGEGGAEALEEVDAWLIARQLPRQGG